MTQEEKAQIYGSLLNEHTKCFNEINRIKGESLDLNKVNQVLFCICTLMQTYDLKFLILSQYENPNQFH